MRCVYMIAPSPNQNQTSFLAPDLIDQLNPEHPLLQRLNRNDLKGFKGDQINVLMAAAFIFKKWMRLFLLPPKKASCWNGLTEFLIKRVHHHNLVMAR